MTPPALPPAAQRLRQGRLLLAEAARAGGINAYPALGAALMDAYFRERLDELRTASPGLCATPFALVAVGGYGRAELCPASDVDVLLLYENAIAPAAEELSRGLFHPLWDLGLDLGHGVRTLADCLRLAGEDMLVLTSLLDVRHIAGEGALAARLQRRLAETSPPGRAAAFGQWVLEHNAGRRARHGDSSGLLEPELKNGLGGLRDAHQIRCSAPHAIPVAGRSALLPDDLAGSKRTRLRAQRPHGLHLAAGRKTDRLFFDLQPQVARTSASAARSLARAATSHKPPMRTRVPHWPTTPPGTSPLPGPPAWRKTRPPAWAAAWPPVWRAAWPPAWPWKRFSHACTRP
jgi:[protein-PII] uridylyltransferase